MDKTESEKIDKLLDTIFIKEKGEEYLEFSNSVGQRYVIPSSHIRTGLSLYHASRIKGKLFKFLLSFIKGSSILLSQTGCEKSNRKPSSALYDLLTETFHEKELTLAVSCGTPGIHQKIILQVSHHGRVLGYGKISDRKPVGELFTQESKLLDYLHKKGINQIPENLFCGELLPGICLFIQDTVKKDRALSGGKDMRLIWDFLSDLHEKTARDIPFRQTGYYSDIQALRENIEKYGISGSALLERTISDIETYFLRHPVRFSLYHGDLTPWNTFIHNRELYVFDWEYSKHGYPPFLDFFHFFTQYAFYEKQWDAEKTYRKFRTITDSIAEYIPDPISYYKAYILSIIQFYFNRDRECGNLVSQKNMEFRIGLLTALNRQ